MGFAERMTRLRHELAGPRSSLAEFAALLDVSRHSSAAAQDASAGFARSRSRLPRSAYAHHAGAQGLADNPRAHLAPLDYVCHNQTVAVRDGT